MSRERGSGRIGVVVWIALMGAAVFAAVQMIPMKVAVYEFHDHVETQTRFMATSSRFDKAKLREAILDKAEELSLPVNPKHLSIKRTGKHIQVHLEHEVDVDLAVYTWVWKYDKTWESLMM